MDQRQKERITSVANKLADTLETNEFADHLQDFKLVTPDQVEEILRTIQSKFSRNLKLIYAAQECKDPQAFLNFVKIIERIDQGGSAAWELAEDYGGAEGNIKKDSVRSMLGKIFNKFKSDGSFPLGLGSSSSSSHTTMSCYSPSASSSSYQSSQNINASNISSPLKEKHQATLVVRSSGDSNNRSQSETQQQQQQRQQSMADSGYRLAPRFQDGQLPITPPTVSQSNRGAGARAGDRSQSRSICKFSQTPNRPSDLTSISELSLSEGDLEAQRRGQLPASSNQQQEEPVVCWHPYAPNHESASGASSPHRCIPSYSSASSESGESISESLIMDQNFIFNSNVMSAMAREGSERMMVKMATVCHNNFNEEYKMTARPRGKCLIVNNINFENDIFPTRKGSDVDAQRFDDIFKQLGFETIMTMNLTADQMREKFQELSAACKPEHDALFVFILSHGSEHGIYGADGLEVDLDSDIISCFSNRNCKAMIGKPKVFVIQACRGKGLDCGGDGDATDSIAWPAASPVVRAASSQENQEPERCLSSQISDGKRRKYPKYTDMLLVFSCQAGFVSVRNETKGSWLGWALAYFISHHAHDRDLMRILNLVTSDIIQQESSNGYIQSTELKLLGWSKNFYFNPGIFL